MTTVDRKTPVREPARAPFGLAHILRLRYHPVTHSTWLRERYGQVYKMRVFGTEMYVVSGPEAFDKVFVNRDKVFASGPAWSYFIGPFFNRGLMLLDFDEHLHHRRIMQHAFGTDQLRSYHDLMLPHVREQLAPWSELSRPRASAGGVERGGRVSPARASLRARATGASRPDRAEPRLEHMFRDLTLELALEVFVGVELAPDERRRINEAFLAAVRAGTSVVRRDLPLDIGPWSKGLRARETLEEFFYGALPAKRRDGGDDLFAQLCVARDDEGNEFSDDDIVNHMIFLLMAAHDTTTTTLTQMAYQLAKHPDWQQRCREDADAIGDEPSYDDLAGWESLDLVMKESMRICAPVPSIPRTATREVVIDGHRIPEGAIVSNSPYANHYLSEVWPEPERFDPERFAADRREDKVHKQAFQAFGAGVHKCIGMHFAGMEVRGVMHEMLRKYEWRVPGDYEVPIDMAALPRTRDGLPVTLRRRGAR